MCRSAGGESGVGGQGAHHPHLLQGVCKEGGEEGERVEVVKEGSVLVRSMRRGTVGQIVVEVCSDNITIVWGEWVLQGILVQGVLKGLLETMEEMDKKGEEEMMGKEE